MSYRNERRNGLARKYEQAPLEEAICESEFEFSDYFVVRPNWSEDIHKTIDYHSTFFIKATLHYSEPSMALNFIFGNMASEKQDNSLFLLDIGITNSEQIKNLNEIDNWLETGHQRLELFFDAAFTDRAHQELFSEVK